MAGLKRRPGGPRFKGTSHEARLNWSRLNLATPRSVRDKPRDATGLTAEQVAVMVADWKARHDGA